MVYLPTFSCKNQLNVGKYTIPMDPSWVIIKDPREPPLHARTVVHISWLQRLSTFGLPLRPWSKPPKVGWVIKQASYICAIGSKVPLLGGGNSNIFGIFTPKFGEDEPILTSIFFKGVETTLLGGSSQAL